MAIQKYRRIGIRRDNNLGDLANTGQALNVLLAKLIGESPDSFVSEDLDAIRGISSLGLTPTGYQNIGGSTIEVTPSNGNLTPTVFKPIITYQNKLDRIRVFTGEPRINGGNGLTANYYNPSSIFENTPNIFSGAPFKIDNFWEEGQFSYSGKITPEAIDANGGVQWEGFFIPTVTGIYGISVYSSACFTFDFQTEGYTTGIGTYTEISRIGITTTFSGSGTIDTNTVTLTSAANAKYVAVGQSVSASGIVAGTTVDAFNLNTGVITLTPPTGSDFAVSSTFSGNITFSKAIGQPTNISYSTYYLQALQRYRIRFRYYIPSSINAELVSRYFNVDLDPPNGVALGAGGNLGAGDGLRYNNLYSLDYNFNDSAKGSINRFLDGAINFGGGTIGSSTNSNQYVRVTSSKKIDVRYQPKTSINDVIKTTIIAPVRSGINGINTSNTSNIEVGNYVFGTGITDGTTVTLINPNNAFFLSQNGTSNSTSTLTFVEHRGFVQRATGSVSSGTATLTSGNTGSLAVDMIVIGTGLQSYTKITSITSSTQFTISPSQSISSTQLYFYQSKGLLNNGLAAFCGANLTRCLIALSDAALGSSTIQLQSIPTDISVVGWAVSGYYFANGTTIQSTSTSPASITISSPTIQNLPAGSNFTISEPNSGDRQLCCPPTDTSPPFNATLSGLETVPAAPSLRIESGNVIFGALRANVSTANITAASNTNTSGSRLKIQTPSVQVGAAQTTIFKILCA